MEGEGGASGEGLIVRKIEEGTVIDHVEPGKSFTILKVLGLLDEPGDKRISVVVNAESRKMGRKDIVKIEGLYLRPDEADFIAVISPRATINVIRGGWVVEKRRVSPPRRVEGILACPNPTCISRKEREPVKPVMELVDSQGPVYRCIYCGTLVKPWDIPRLVNV